MISRLILTVIVAFFTTSPLTEIITGKVVKVADGDTLVIMHGYDEIRIRLYEIDTPELDQPYGAEAKQALYDLTFNRIVSVTVETIDDYGRIVGKVFIRDLDVNAEMIRGGHAWVFRRYAKDKDLYELEQAARENQLGLWALPEEQRIPPWQWRYRRK